MTPIHAYVVHGPVLANLGKARECGLEEVSKLRLGHLAGGHREFAMLGPALTTGMPVNRDVKRGGR